LPAVSRLNHLPRAVPFLGVLALMIGGIFVPGWGWLLLLLLLVFLLWTLYLSWPALDTVNRFMRATLVLMVAALTLTQAFPRA
jgi:hypothetical protein